MQWIYDRQVGGCRGTDRDDRDKDRRMIEVEKIVREINLDIEMTDRDREMIERQTEINRVKKIKGSWHSQDTKRKITAPIF